MLTEQRIAEIEERAYIAANNRDFRSVDCQDAWQVVTMDVPALLADRAELVAEIERLKRDLAKWNERIEDYHNCDMCELKAYEDCYLICENKDSMVDFILGQNDCYEKLRDERDRLFAENEALKNSLKYVSSSCATCKHFGVDAPCEKCVGKNFSEYVFDYDRFKDGGGGQ